MAIQKVGVIGCGLMGHGIAQVAAQAGFTVVVREAEQGALDKGLGRVTKSLAKLVEKEKLTQADADAAQGRLSGTLELSDLVAPAAAIAREGRERAALLFVAQRGDVRAIAPCPRIDPAFAEALADAGRAGVELAGRRVAFDDRGHATDLGPCPVRL